MWTCDVDRMWKTLRSRRRCWFKTTWRTNSRFTRHDSTRRSRSSRDWDRDCERKTANISCDNSVIATIDYFIPPRIPTSCVWTHRWCLWKYLLPDNCAHHHKYARQTSNLHCCLSVWNFTLWRKPFVRFLTNKTVFDNVDMYVYIATILFRSVGFVLMA